MAAGTSKSVSFIAIICILIPCLIGAWFAAPNFLPMFWWTKVDLPAIASANSIPLATLSTQFDIEVRYNPRGEGDPVPWQIITMKPAWNTLYPKAEDEELALIRCTFISQNDGEPPSTTFINSTFKDRYFKAKAVRLPPGTLGFNAKRPVVIYERMALEKMSIGEAMRSQDTVIKWDNDDEWQGRDDGWSPPQAP